MSKSAALLLVLTLGAGACSTTEPPQTIVAVVPASETDVAAPESTDTSEDGITDSGDEEELGGSTANETSVPGTAPSSTTTAPATTTPATTAPATTAPANTTPKETTAPSTDPGTPTVAELLSGSLANNAEQLSARFNGGVSIAGDFEGESIDLTIDIAGAYDAKTGAAEITMDLSSIGRMLSEDMNGSEMAMFDGMFDEPVQMKMIGDKAYVKWSLFDMFTGTEGMWLEMEIEESDMSGLEGLAGPADLMELLDGLDGEVTVVGTDKIGGVDATHYEVRLDLDTFGAALAELDAVEADELEAMAEMFQDLPLHIWIDADGRLRRVEITISSDSLADLIGPSDSFNAMVWYEISDYGSDIVITAPPADRVVSGESIGLF